jgi:hypothetical protein
MAAKYCAVYIHTVYHKSQSIFSTFFRYPKKLGMKMRNFKIVAGAHVCRCSEKIGGYGFLSGFPF